MTDLALGTVQFGIPYGIANESGQVSQSEVNEILKRAAAAGVTTIDTAIAYGQSETRLGTAGVAAWRVITKLPQLPSDERDVPGWIHGQVAASLRRLGISQLEAVLLHCPADLRGPYGEVYREGLVQLKRAGLVRALGVSIYDPDELNAIREVWQPDIVQCPINVFDRRIIRTGWLRRLALEGVRVHARSAFLQGLLVMHRDRRPDVFGRWTRLLDRWLGWCAEHEVSPLHAALSFVMAQPELECAVVGVDSLAQLEQILAAAIVAAPQPPEDLFSDDRDLLDPSRWRRA